MQKKLLQINIQSNMGSTGRIAENIGLYAQKNGWVVCTAFGRNSNKSNLPQFAISKKYSFYLNALRARTFDDDGFLAEHNTRKLIAKIESFEPDIVHLHNLHGYYVNAKLLFDYLKSNKINTIWTLHDCWAFTGHCTFFENCQKWRTLCDNCPQKKSYPASYILDRSRKNFLKKKMMYDGFETLTLVPVSHWLDTLVSKSMLGGAKRVLIHNGVDTFAFAPSARRSIFEKLGLHGRFVALGAASVWSQRKGLADFLRLSKILAPDEVIVLVGLKKEQIRSLPKNITGITRTESIAELAELYASADVFVNPTYLDNFPTTNIEALACGTPVITYNTGGSAEAINAETGFSIAPNNINGIYSAIKEIRARGKSAFAAKCRTRAETLWSNKVSAQKYLDLYNSFA